MADMSSASDRSDAAGLGLIMLRSFVLYVVKAEGRIPRQFVPFTSLGMRTLEWPNAGCDWGSEWWKGVACRHPWGQDKQRRGSRTDCKLFARLEKTLEYQEKKALWDCMVRVECYRVSE